MTEQSTGSQQQAADESAARAIHAALWGDVLDAPTFVDLNPLLAHYTSIETLEKIISGKEVWLSHPMFMNDSEELHHGIDMGAEALRNNDAIVRTFGTPEVRERFMDYFQRFYREFLDNQLLDTYVLCFCEHQASEDSHGLLSMWRAYGKDGGGVAILFDASQIPLVADRPTFLLDKIKYLTPEERNSWIDAAIAKLVELFSSLGTNEHVLQMAAWFWFQRLKIFSLFTKHIGFKEENEWRIVSLKDRQGVEDFAPLLGYSVSQHGVEPKLKLKIEELPGAGGSSLSFENLIRGIVLGPTVSSQLSRMSLQRMLELHNLPSLAQRVSASGIPFRSFKAKSVG